ncbi:MAG: DUF4328 domain-containing protein [Chloroflexota bacterium]|nr:DUF4328 domain-containing protein [Chloroflexota bacterium]
MTSPVYTCLHCGMTATLTPGQQFCTNCHQPLTAVAPTAAAPLPSSVRAAQGAIPYESGHTRAQWAVGLLAVSIMLDLISMISDFLEMGLLSSASNGGTISTVDAAANDSRQALIAVGQVLVYIATVVAFLLWIHRAYRNLPALGTSGLKYSPRWAVGGFFVPFLNLVRPFQVMREIWQASSPDADPRSSTAWQTVLITPLPGVWWGSWLLGNVCGQLAVRTATGGNLEQLILSDWLSITSLVLNIVAAALLIRIIRTIDSGQEERRRRMAELILPPASAPAVGWSPSPPGA